MTDLLTQYGPVGGLVGVTFILAGVVARLVRQRRNGNGCAELHSVRTKAQEAITRVSTIEGRFGEIDKRLSSIESGQAALTVRIDRVLELL